MGGERREAEGPVAGSSPTVLWSCRRRPARPPSGSPASAAAAAPRRALWPGVRPRLRAASSRWLGSFSSPERIAPSASATKRIEQARMTPPPIRSAAARSNGRNTGGRRRRACCRNAPARRAGRGRECRPAARSRSRRAAPSPSRRASAPASTALSRNSADHRQEQRVQPAVIRLFEEGVHQRRRGELIEPARRHSRRTHRPERRSQRVPAGAVRKVASGPRKPLSTTRGGCAFMLRGAAGVEARVSALPNIPRRGWRRRAAA